TLAASINGRHPPTIKCWPRASRGRIVEGEAENSPGARRNICPSGARCTGGFQPAIYPLMGWSGRALAPPASEAGKGRQRQGARHATQANSGIAVIGVDIGKNSFHVVGHDKRGAIVLRQKWSRGQVEARLANLRPCLIGMEACVGAHHLSRKLQMLGHDARLMPAKYVRPYSKGQKNDFRDAEAIVEAVQRPTM